MKQDYLKNNINLTKEWITEKNSHLCFEELTLGSQKTAWWRCSNNHEWKAPIYKRRVSGCPVCANRVIIKNYNDLFTVKPWLKQFWDFQKNQLNPYELSFSSAKKAWWKCSLGHSFLKRVYELEEGSECSNCNKNASIISGVNDLKTLKPEIAAEWSNNNLISSSQIGVGSRYIALWSCSKGHEWEYEVKARCTLKTSCLYCSGRKLLQGVNDLKTLYPQYEKYWSTKNKRNYNETTLSGDEKKAWTCFCGFQWEEKPRVQLLRSKERFCKACARTVLVEGVNDLATIKPWVVEYWSTEENSLTPQEIRYSSHQEIFLRCNKNHSWTTTANSVREFVSCPVCFPIERSSLGERELSDFVKDILPAETIIHRNDRSLIHPYEIDIYLPEFKIAIEYNGEYWHSEERLSQKYMSAKDYHLMKKRLCRGRGVDLIFVWEKDWLFFRDELKRELQFFLSSREASPRLKRLE